jgi:hypothetical protein
VRRSAFAIKWVGPRRTRRPRQAAPAGSAGHRAAGSRPSRHAALTSPRRATLHDPDRSGARRSLRAAGLRHTTAPAMGTGPRMQAARCAGVSHASDRGMFCQSSQNRSRCRARRLIICPRGSTAARPIGGRRGASERPGHPASGPPGSCSDTTVCSTGWTAAFSGEHPTACSRRYSVACTRDRKSSRL